MDRKTKVFHLSVTIVFSSFEKNKLTSKSRTNQ